MPLILDSLQKAIAALQAAQTRSEDPVLMAGLDLTMQSVVQSGVIQHFEFTYELTWKFMRRQLESDIGRSAVEGVNRRDLFRIAAEQGLINDVEAWFGYHLARNETSHTYDASVAARVYATTLDFARDAAALLAVLESRNA
jgi:nucleotidyltransferase substrate binding protein (TIGR01987 family)